MIRAAFRFMVTVAIIAFLAGLCVGLTGCGQVDAEHVNAVNAYDAWHEGCVNGTQQWTTTADETGQNKAFIVVCSSVPGRQSHLLPNGDGSL